MCKTLDLLLVPFYLFLWHCSAISCASLFIPMAGLSYLLCLPIYSLGSAQLSLVPPYLFPWHCSATFRPCFIFFPPPPPRQAYSGNYFSLGTGRLPLVKIFSNMQITDYFQEREKRLFQKLLANTALSHYSVAYSVYNILNSKPPRGFPVRTQSGLDCFPPNWNRTQNHRVC